MSSLFPSTGPVLVSYNSLNKGQGFCLKQDHMYFNPINKDKKLKSGISHCSFLAGPIRPGIFALFFFWPLESQEIQLGSSLFASQTSKIDHSILCLERLLTKVGLGSGGTREAGQQMKGILSLEMCTANHNSGHGSEDARLLASLPWASDNNRMWLLNTCKFLQVASFSFILLWALQHTIHSFKVTYFSCH